MQGSRQKANLAGYGCHHLDTAFELGTVLDGYPAGCNVAAYSALFADENFPGGVDLSIHLTLYFDIFDPDIGFNPSGGGHQQAVIFQSNRPLYMPFNG